MYMYMYTCRYMYTHTSYNDYHEKTVVYMYMYMYNVYRPLPFGWVLCLINHLLFGGGGGSSVKVSTAVLYSHLHNVLPFLST